MGAPACFNAPMLASGLRPEIRWLASGFLMTLFSGFGQTYFIALFAAELKSGLSLTERQFGGRRGG